MENPEEQNNPPENWRQELDKLSEGFWESTILTAEDLNLRINCVDK